MINIKYFTHICDVKICTTTNNNNRFSVTQWLEHTASNVAMQSHAYTVSAYTL